MSTIPVNSTVTLNDYIKTLSTTDNDTSAYIPVSNNSTLKRMQISKITQSLSVASSSANGMMSSQDKAKLDHIQFAPINVTSTSSTPGFGGTVQVRIVGQADNGGLTTATHGITIPNSIATTSGPGLLRTLNGNTANFLRGDGTWQTLPNVSVSGAGLAPDIPDMQTTYDHPRFLAATAMSSQADWYHSDVQAFSASTVHGGFVPRVNRISTATGGSTSVNENDFVYTHRNGQNLAQWRSLAYLGLTTANAAEHTSYNNGSWSGGSAGYMSGLDALIVRNGASTAHRGTVPIISTSAERQWYQIAGNATSATFKKGSQVLVNEDQSGLMSPDMLSNLTLLHNDFITFSGKKSTDPDTYYPYIHFMMPPTSGYHLTRLAIVTHTDQIGLYLMNIRYTNSSTNATSTTSAGASYHIPSGFTASLIHVGGFDFTALAVGTAQNSNNGDFYVNLRAGSSSSPYPGSLYISLLGGMKVLDVGGTANNVTYAVSKEL